MNEGIKNMATTEVSLITEARCCIIGKKIKTLRKEKKITQQELGRRTGFVASYISQIENGSRSPSLETVHILATELGTTFEDIMSGECAVPMTPVKCDIVFSSGERMALLAVAWAFIKAFILGKPSVSLERCVRLGDLYTNPELALAVKIKEGE